MHNSAELPQCQVPPISEARSLHVARVKRKRQSIIQAVVIALRVCDQEVSVRSVQDAIRTLRGKSFRSDYIRGALSENDYYLPSGHSRTHHGHSEEPKSLTKLDERTQLVPTCARTSKELRTGKCVAADAATAPGPKVNETETEPLSKIHRSTIHSESEAQEARGEKAVSPVRPPKSPRDLKIDTLVQWFGEQSWGQLDRTKAARQKWAALLDLARDDIERVKKYAIEARRNKHLILTPEYPTFNLHAIWFYARYKHNDIDSDDDFNDDINQTALRKFKEFIASGEINGSRVRGIIQMFAVRAEQVQRAFSESDAKLLFDSVSDEAWRKNRGDTT